MATETDGQHRVDDRIILRRWGLNRRGGESAKHHDIGLDFRGQRSVNGARAVSNEVFATARPAPRFSSDRA